jgi:hypothetical protein
MIIRFLIKYYALLILLVLSLPACRSAKNTAEVKEPPKDRSASYLLKRYERNKFEYDWVGMKIDADFITMGESQGFKASIRMKKDSAIWISISPALGIEVFRILITPDSLKYLSKIPDNKFYYIGTSASLSELAKIDLDFDMLQDILIGNAIGLEKDEGKFRTSVDGYNYLLTSKYKRKVRRVVGIDDRKLSPTDTIVVNPNDPRYQRSVRRADEDELIVSRYWLESENFRMVRSVFNDLINQRAIDIAYSDFKLEGEQYYPTRCVMKLAEASKQEELSFKITKLVTDKTYEFPFEIPEDFERKLNP